MAPRMCRATNRPGVGEPEVWLRIPCWVRRWNLTQYRSLFALTMLKVWLPKPCMCRYEYGMPRSLMKMVTWCSASGSEVQKSLASPHRTQT